MFGTDESKGASAIGVDVGDSIGTAATGPNGTAVTDSSEDRPAPDRNAAPGVSRRAALVGAASLFATAVAGCLADAGDGATDPADRPARRPFRIGPGGEGISFDPLVEVGRDHTPEGLAYRGGRFYTGQREGPATIREYDTDGERTGAEFTFDDAAVAHTNTMDWVDDRLWVSDSSTNATYVVDWDGRELVDRIEHADPITGSWRAVLPTRTGEPKLLFNEWRGDTAWLVDLEGALADGTTDGNVERELRNGFFTDPQTAEWVDGYLYTTTHGWIVKSRLPYADRLPDGCPVTSYDVEWAFEFEDGYTLEQLTYNGDDDEFYLIDRGGSATVYAGRETRGDHRNDSFRRWSPTDGSPVGGRALDVRGGGTARLAFTVGRGERKVGWVDVRTYDPGADDLEVGVGIGTAENETYALGVWSDAASDSYAWHDDGTWYDTGVERAGESWVRFGWEITETSIEGYVSLDRGRSWERAGTASGDDTTVNHLWITNRTGNARVGHWTLDLRNAPET